MNLGKKSFDWFWWLLLKHFLVGFKLLIFIKKGRQTPRNGSKKAAEQQETAKWQKRKKNTPWSKKEKEWNQWSLAGWLQQWRDTGRIRHQSLRSHQYSEAWPGATPSHRMIIEYLGAIVRLFHLKVSRVLRKMFWTCNRLWFSDSRLDNASTKSLYRMTYSFPFLFSST